MKDNHDMKKNNSLPLLIQVLYGVGVSYAIVDQIFAQWVLYYYLPPSSVQTLQPLLPPLFISIALLIARFIDVIFEPIIGYLSDKFQSKWGRRIPFIAFGTIPLTLATIAYFFPIKSDNNIPTFIYLSIIGSLFFIFYTIVGGPYNALIPEISKNKKDRLNLSTWQSVFRLIYTAIAMILPGMLIEVLGSGNDEKGIRLMVIFLGILSSIGCLITVISIKERKYSTAKSPNIKFKDSLKLALSNKSFMFYLTGFMFFFLGFNILRASINYYIEDIMGYGKTYITIASGLMFGVAALSFVPIKKLSLKFGYKKPMLGCLVLLIIGSLGLFGIGKVFPSQFGFVIFSFVGFPVAGAAFIFPPAMLSEIAAVESSKSGLNREGLLFGFQGVFLKLAFLFSIMILPILLVQGSGLSLVDSMTTMPEGAHKTGIYSTSIFATISFILSFIFYSFFKEESSE